MHSNYSQSNSSDMMMNDTSIPDGDQVDHGWSVSGIENSALVRTTYGLIAFSGITGNALVCLVLLRVPALRTRTSQFIINLAITDFINCIWVIPFHLFPQTPPVPPGFAGELMCRVYISKFTLWISTITSAYCLVAVTMERYVAVIHPHRYKYYFTTKLTVVIGLCCWCVGFLVTAFFFVQYDVVDGSCVFVPFSSAVYTKLYGIMVFTVIYGFPSTIILIWQFRIIRALRRQAKAINASSMGSARNGGAHGTGGGENPTGRWQLKVAQEMQKTFFVVIVVYMLTWAPNQFLFLAYSLGAAVDFTKSYYHFSVILGLANSCVNPVIYVFKNKAFRRGIPQALGCRKLSSRSLFSMFENSVIPNQSNGHSPNGTASGTIASAH